jgi:nucleoside-diphosphate-sugar epimerase
MAGSPLVLVTGSGGRIGQAVVRELKARGRPVRGFDLAPTPGLDDFVVGDTTDAETVRRATEGAGAVVHLAATPDDDDFLTRLLPNNIVGGYQVLEAARLAGVRRLVLASSGQVVWWQRMSGPWPIGVDVPPTPRSWYAATKLFLEAAGRALAEGHGLSVIAARLGWCPRTRAHAEELGRTDWGPDVYLSPGDAGRFFACAVEAPAELRFAVVYAMSRPLRQAQYDQGPAKELLGYEPRDAWPQGAEEILGLGEGWAGAVE